MKVGDTGQMLVLQADSVGQVMILFSQSMDRSGIYIKDPGPKSKTGQAEWHGSPRFMQSQGKQEWKVTRGGYNTETQTGAEDWTIIIVVQPEEY